jgi:hypothetical protein
MADAFFSSFMAQLTPRLSSERIWSARILTSPEDAPAAAAAADGSFADASSTLLVMEVASAKAGESDADKILKFSCIMRGEAGADDRNCQLWEARVTAAVLLSHRDALGIKAMGVAEFFQLFWAGIHTASVPSSPGSSGSSGDVGGNSDDDGGGAGRWSGAGRSLLLEYTIGESIVLSGEFRLELVCAVPAVLFPIMWKLQASSGAGAAPGAACAIVRHASQSTVAALADRHDSPSKRKASASASKFAVISRLRVCACTEATPERVFLGVCLRRSRGGRSVGGSRERELR